MKSYLRMCLVFCSSLLGAVSKADTIHFTPNISEQWRIINDGVMGGLSQATFHVNAQNQGVFSGEVSLDNNGGFSSIRHQPQMPIPVGPQRQIIIKLKGDGKKYQFRVRGDLSERHSYVAQFDTTGDWQEITIPLSNMNPSFHGRILDLPNFNHSAVAELGFLIADKQAGLFQLAIESIKLE